MHARVPSAGVGAAAAHPKNRAPPPPPERVRPCDTRLVRDRCCRHDALPLRAAPPHPLCRSCWRGAAPCTRSYLVAPSLLQGASSLAALPLRLGVSVLVGWRGTHRWRQRGNVSQLTWPQWLLVLVLVLVLVLRRRQPCTCTCTCAHPRTRAPTRARTRTRTRTRTQRTYLAPWPAREVLPPCWPRGSPCAGSRSCSRRRPPQRPVPLGHARRPPPWPGRFQAGRLARPP